ncbi:MAG: ATPase, type [Deltaproteobacteria bacterium]|nr:ATPase, type [Deltaproteobacteria bacterium]
MSDWHRIDAVDVVKRLGTDATAGLAESEAARRLQEHGRNEIAERGGRSAWKILWEQLTATMVVILIIAAVVSGLLGSFKDTGSRNSQCRP